MQSEINIILFVLAVFLLHDVWLEAQQALSNVNIYTSTHGWLNLFVSRQ